MFEQIEADINTALRDKNATAVSVLRMLKSALHNAEIEKGTELDEAECIAVVRKQAKQRRESIDSYAQAGRGDKAGEEEQELRIIERYLPRDMDEKELQRLVAETIEEVGASTQADIGTVMKVIKPKVAERAEGSAVAAEVRAQLS